MGSEDESLGIRYIHIPEAPERCLLPMMAEDRGQRNDEVTVASDTSSRLFETKVNGAFGKWTVKSME